LAERVHPVRIVVEVTSSASREKEAKKSDLTSIQRGVGREGGGKKDALAGKPARTTHAHAGDSR